MSDVAVIIAAGGSGRRLGGPVPKQFLAIGGVPILVRTLRQFASVPQVRRIVIVGPGRSLSRIRRLVDTYRIRGVTRIVRGGRERQHSVWNGLRALTPHPSIVLVHDAVRPLVRKREILQVIRQARKHGAAVVGVRVRDTIKTSGRHGWFARTLPRHVLWAVQTPQGFRYDILYRAHVSAARSRFLGTDDGSLVERLHIPVRIVPGDEGNIKITTRHDLAVAGTLLSRRRQGG